MRCSQLGLTTYRHKLPQVVFQGTDSDQYRPTFTEHKRL